MKKLFFLFSMVCLSISFSASSQDSPVAETEVKPEVVQVAETTVLPAWATIVLSLLSVLAGYWGNKTLVADKAVKAKETALVKVEQAANLFDTLESVLRTGNVSPEAVQTAIQQWKIIRNKDVKPKEV